MITQSEYLESLIEPFPFPAKGETFPRFMEEVAYLSEAYTRRKIKEYLEYMDYRFRISEKRKERYYVKDYKARTIITMYGEITYYRTIYWDRIKGRRYTYVDERIGIEKWMRYTNDVAAYVAEAYADENSMIKVGIEVGNLIHCKFSLKDNRIYAIPRQTISNLIRRVKEIRIEPTEKKREVEDLYILMDEKYLPDHKDQDGTRSNKMIKSALIVEGINRENPKRHQYIHPYYFSSYSSRFSDDLYDILSNRYNTDTLKTIHVLADGANWIKSVSQDLSLSKVKPIQYLDKFHFSQSLWRITKNEKLYKIAKSYLYHNNRKALKKLFHSLSNGEKNSNMNYILNNWTAIQNMIHLKQMNCAMEQCISHHIHSQFANVPKVYAKHHINRYLSLRDNYRNKENIKDLFIRALDDKDDSDITLLNKPSFDYSHFDKQVSLPYYTASLASGKKPIRFTPHDDFHFIY